MEKIHATMILEILGRPAEHLKESLNTLVIRLESEKGVKVIDKKHHDPISVEDAKDLFTAFAEVEVEFETLENYFGIMFAYMPSNIEIIKPEKITLSNQELNFLGSKLMQRLHEYDAVTKNTLFERNIILEKLKKAAPKVFEELTAPKEKTKEEKKN